MKEESGGLALEASFLVVRTMQDGGMILFGAGRYIDRTVQTEAGWKFASKIVVLDSRQIDTLLATHHRLVGPRRDEKNLPADQVVISASHTDRQSTLLIRTDQPILDPAWTVSQLTLEDLVLAYMGRRPSTTEQNGRPLLEVQR